MESRHNLRRGLLVAACLGMGLEGMPPRKDPGSGTKDALHPGSTPQVPLLEKRNGRLVFYPGGRFAAPVPWRVAKELDLKPGADLAGRRLAFRDLSGLSLVNANLSGADLTGANLCGTDLSGANLSRARLAHVKANSGTSLAGARLFMADVEGAVGLPLAQGRLHPFFVADAGEELTLSEYSLPDADFLPDDLLLGPKGDLLLLARGKPRILTISPTGATLALVLTLNPGAQAMALDPRGQLWAVFDRALLHAPGSVTEVGVERHSVFPRTEPGEVLGAALSDRGTLWVSTPDNLSAFTWRRRGQDLKTTPHALPGLDLRCLAVAPDGRQVFGIDRDPGQVVVVTRGAVNSHRITLPPDWRAGQIAMGTDNRLWISQENGMGLACFVPSLEKPRMRVFPHPAPLGAKAPRMIQLCRGGDGRMWFAQANPAAIGYFDQETMEGVSYPMPEGTHPDRIAVGRDGLVYFITKGRAAVGCLRPRRPAEKKTEPSPNVSSSSWETPVFQPRPPRIPARERRARALALPVAAEEGEELALPLPVAPKREETKASPSTSPEVRTAPVRAPLDVLDELGLFLDDARVGHILQRHCFDLNNTRGQFNAAFSTPEGLLGLLAEGATRAASVASVVRRFDPMGIRHTPCTLDQDIGWFYSPASEEWKPTSCLDIVTREVDLEDGTRAQVVLSAYPISPTRF
jgi:hypothetical protein